MKKLITQFIPIVVVSAIAGICVYRIAIGNTPPIKPDKIQVKQKETDLENKLPLTTLKRGKMEMEIIRDDVGRNLFKDLHYTDSVLNKLKLELKKYDSIWLYGNVKDKDLLRFLCKQGTRVDSLTLFKVNTNKLSFSQAMYKANKILLVDSAILNKSSHDDSVYLCKNCLPLE